MRKLVLSIALPCLIFTSSSVGVAEVHSQQLASVAPTATHTDRQLVYMITTTLSFDGMSFTLEWETVDVYPMSGHLPSHHGSVVPQTHPAVIMASAMPGAEAPVENGLIYSF